MPGTTKHISIVVGGAGNQIHDVEIQRGVTVRDLLEQLNLTGHLSKVSDPTPLKGEKDLFSQVEDGEKLILAPSTPVACRKA